jgi:hypothetical protein
MTESAPEIRENVRRPTSPVAGESASAVISEDGLYRYTLTRTWDTECDPMVFVMLNPSTADASVDDPTIRRCRSFAKREGAGGLVVVNLFAYRATKPADLWAAKASGVDIEGPHNRATMIEALDTAATPVEFWDFEGSGDPFPIVCAWGAGGPWSAEAGQRFMNLASAYDDTYYRITRFVSLGTTASGTPRHPLYVKGDQPLVPFAEPVS